MTITTKARVNGAKRAIRVLSTKLPWGNQTREDVSRNLGINSAHISHLYGDDYLTPALERKLIQAKVLAPRPDPIPVEPCEECGEVHIKIHCTYKRAQKKGRPRFSVAANDPEMVMDQLEKHYPGLFSLNVQERSGL